MKHPSRITDARLPSAVLVVSLVLSACSGGAGPAKSGGQDQQDTSAGGPTTTAATAGAPQGGDAAAVSDLTKKRRQATFKVTYTWTASGSSPQPSETWYSKPPRSRIDHGDAKADNWLSEFVLPTGVFACETSSGSSTCWRAATSARTIEELSFAALIMAAYEDLLSDPAFRATRSTRTIAGQQGSCSSAANILALGLADLTICHASNGVPLFFSWKAGKDTFTMEATSYGTSVSDKDLDLLAPPQN